MNRIEELEACFKKYPDVPREVVIKEDCLRWGIGWTQAALEASQGYQAKSYYIFQFDRSSLKDMHGKEDLISPEEVKLVGGDYRLRDTVIANHLSVSSPYLVDIIKGKLALCDRSEPDRVRYLADVKLRRPPKYYSMTFEDGRAYWDIGAAPMWGYNFNVPVLRSCQYWGDNEECKYCDINANVREQKKMGKQYTVFKTPEEVATVAAAAFGDRLNGPPTIEPGKFEYPWEIGPHSTQITGGTITSQVKGKDDAEFYLEYVRAVKDKIGSRFPLALQTAAKDKKTCQRMKEAGVDVQCANFEVWDKSLFKIICPGKEKFVGHDEWIRRLCDSVNVFGEAGVHPGFVAGVEMAQPWGFKTVDEAVKSTTEGMEFLMSHGITPRPITWCIEPQSALAGHPMIPLDYHVRIDRNWYELWTKYGLPHILAYGVFETGRGLYPNGAYCDMGPSR